MGFMMTRMHAQEIDIDSLDGVLSAYEVAPAGESRRPGIIFMMDGLGYRSELKSMAERLASHGYHVLLPDLYHRIGRHVHFDAAAMMQPEKVAEMRKRIGILSTDMIMGDVAACLDFLASRNGVDSSRVGIIGYCMGGRNAFLAASRFPDHFRAMAAIHPGGVVTNESTSPHLLARSVKATLYFGVAKDDVFFTREQSETLAKTLTGFGKCYLIEHYEARHGWALSDTPVYDLSEAERHWGAILEFFSEALSGNEVAR